MNFQAIEYIDWFRNNWHDIEYDLATSGLHPINQKELGILFDDLNLGETLWYGHSRLIELISEIYGVEKNEVLITSGSTHANFLVCSHLISEGDEVVVEHPVYSPLLDVVKACKAKVKLLERRFEEGYRLNVERLNEMINKNTKMIVLTNLHNPTGAMIDKSTLNTIKEIADDNQIFVLSDEVYRDFMLEDAAPTFSSLTGLGISTCSLSKFYGSGSLRIGWAMCDPEIVEEARKINDYLLVSNSCASETFAAMILENRNWFIDKVKKIMSTNYPVIRKWVDEREDLEWIAPRYGFIGFQRLKEDLNTMKLAEHLLSKYRTIISPGRFFGSEDHIRIGFGGKKENLEKGLENVGLALDEVA
jgi:aspartate/methionine/tyrosine aminotransferase